MAEIKKGKKKKDKEIESEFLKTKNMMVDQFDEQLNQILPVNRRLNFQELYETMGVVAHCAILKNNRCALVTSICFMLGSIRFDESYIKRFFDAQIEQERDCKQCTVCYEKREKNISEVEIIFSHPGSKAFN